MRPLIDGHLDLAWNGASHDRELTLELAELNAAEEGMTDVGYRGKATVTFPEMRRGGIYLCLATFLARSGPKLQRKPSYLRTDVDYNTRIGSYAARMPSGPVMNTGRKSVKFASCVREQSWKTICGISPPAPGSVNRSA